MSALSQFQLKNLYAQQVPFIFIGLVEMNQNEVNGWPSWINNVIWALNHEEITNYLNENKIDSGYPIILCCLRGHHSEKIAEKLIELGFINIYTVDGGYSHLLELGD